MTNIQSSVPDGRVTRMTISRTPPLPPGETRSSGSRDRKPSTYHQNVQVCATLAPEQYDQVQTLREKKGRNKHTSLSACAVKCFRWMRCDQARITIVEIVASFAQINTQACLNSPL